jgi:hypothetical protein
MTSLYVINIVVSYNHMEGIKLKKLKYYAFLEAAEYV